MFLTASLDTTVKVWDTQEMDIASTFSMVDKVHVAAFGSILGTSHVIAVGTDRPEVRLCDMNTGAQVHRLFGHRHCAIRTLAWSEELS